jgi:pimeloyl-ACP methyl ester carboxylesterase
MHTALLVLLTTLPAAQPTTPEERAQTLVAALSDGRFADAAQDFDDAFRKTLPGTRLEEIWKQLTAQVGPFQKQVGARVEKDDEHVTAYVRCQFGKAAVDVKVVFDRHNRITGLDILPAAPTKDQYPAPPYAKPDTFREVAVKVGTGEWVLPGTVTVPRGDGPFPAVVLVHGSGPQDRDETLGLAKPFRDLAWGLATRGVAVVRYEKRTKQHAAKVAAAQAFTVKEETSDDALAAADLLRHTQGIDAKGVFVVGHSQGAMMAPKIAMADPAVAGVVMLAAPSRPLEDLMLDQARAGLRNRDKLPTAEVKLLESLQKIAELIKDGKLTNETPRSDLLGETAGYWKSLTGYSATADAGRVDRPLLILQGEADADVSMVEFAGWQTAMAGGYRDRYRAVSDKVPAVKGHGMNGQGFAFHHALPVDPAGALPDGRPFKDVRELKRMLVQDEVPIARNLARQLTVYATGAPVQFSDREEIEKILDAAKATHYGVRSIVHAIVQSELFRNK